MKKIHVLFCVFIIGCSNTKITKYSALPKMVEGDGILLMSIENLSETKQYELFEFAEKTIAETNRVKFLPEQEYYLVSRGLNKEHLYEKNIPDSIISIIALETNCRYILYIEDLNSKKGGTFGYYTPLELDGYNSHYYQESETNSASLMFRLIDTKNQLTESKFQINTKINPLIINEGGGETRINPTTELTAIKKAFEKGMKQLRKGTIKINK